MSRLEELYALTKRDPDVKTMVNAVCARAATNIISLSEDEPELFDELYETAMEMVSDIPLDET